MDNQRKICLLLAVIFCSPVFSEDWKAKVVRNLDALVSSCIVVPCSFTHPKTGLPSSKLRGIWHVKNDRKKIIYYEDQTRVDDNFKGRTRLLGNLGQDNCTLEMVEIKNHDNGPFCFRIELVETAKPTKDMFSFVEDCVSFKMLSAPPDPTLTLPEKIIQGRPCSVTCLIRHTCSTHMPKIRWSRTSDEITVVHRELYLGDWEVLSTLILIPDEKDDHTEITCTVEFHGGKTSSATSELYVKRTENFNHIIIPTVVGLGTAVIFGVLCIFMVKKYKTRIAELQSQDGSMWNRLSRMSRRIRSGGPAPPRSEQRRSIWSRFSRRQRGDVVDVRSVPNNMSSQICDSKNVSKPRFPSPKSQAKSSHYKEDVDDDDYVNTAEMNVYGNL